MEKKQVIFWSLILFVSIFIFYLIIDLNDVSLYSNTSQRIKEQIVYKQDDVLRLFELFDSGKFNQTKAINSISKQDNYNYLKKYPKIGECRKDNLNVWKPNNNRIALAVDYAKPASNTTHNSNYLRAVTIYFPIEKVDNFMIEFKWMYRSWIEMQKHEPKMWRTDLIVFIENDKQFFKTNNFLNELNCKFTNKRTAKEQKPMCTLINYISLKNRVFKPLTNPIFTRSGNSFVKSKYDFLFSHVDIFSDEPTNLLPFYSMSKVSLKKYGYVDSILMAFDGYVYFKEAGFDFLIRSDMDVFLTPLFAKWLPVNCNDFYVGRGGYSDDFNRKRLRRIAADLGLKHAGHSNLGSTWYSTPEQFRLVSYLTIVSMAYLNMEEFSLPEREGKLGTLLWPQWHYGVLLLYGQHLALNHLIGSHQVNVIKLNDLIDYPSANTEQVDSKIHIHVFHGDDLFSKGAFKNGKYDDMKITNQNTSLIKFYCLKMALEAKNLPNSNLKHLLEQEIHRKLI